MVNFKIIDNVNEIHSNHEWIDSVKFNSKNRIVDDQGQSVAADYAGHRYELIAKHERKFSKWKRLTRGLLGIWTVVRSCGREWSSKAVKNLFTKDHESRRFGVLTNPPSQQLPLSNEPKLDETAADFTLLFPEEISLAIFSYLNSQELTQCFCVNKTWKALASDEVLWNALLPRIAFGKAQWETYFGDIGQVPPLPKDIHQILKSPCPFWPGKKVEETHMLMLIPESVNGKPLTLSTLGELVKAPKDGHATQYRYIWDEIINKHGNQATAKSHWVLMTKDVIEGSRNKNYTDQQTLIAELNKRKGIQYEFPNVLDAAICIFMHYVSSQERLFNDQPWTYTRCQENVQGYQVTVGGFSPAGLSVRYDYFVFCNVGVAALRKFFLGH